MDSIVRMANDIAQFHTSYTDEEGRQLVAEHLNKFWPPSMRARFHELIEVEPDGFHPLVLSCAGMVRCDRRNPVNLAGMDRSGSGG